MRLHFSFFYLLLMLFLGFLFFLSTDSAFSTSHGTCPFFRAGTVSYCGESGTICGPSAFINSDCNSVGGGKKQTKTGNQCCSDLGYDYCSSTTTLLCSEGGCICGAGDRTNITANWFCCLNPTPTPIPTSTPTPTPPPPDQCSHLTTCGNCVAAFPCGWTLGAGGFCQVGTSSCPNGYLSWYWWDCATNQCLPPPPTSTPTPKPTRTPTPTPTITPIPTAGPTPTPITCSSYTNCATCIDTGIGRPNDCGWKTDAGANPASGCEPGTFACPALYNYWYWSSCSINECALPTSTPTPTPISCHYSGSVVGELPYQYDEKCIAKNGTFTDYCKISTNQARVFLCSSPDSSGTCNDALKSDGECGPNRVCQVLPNGEPKCVPLPTRTPTPTPTTGPSPTPLPTKGPQPPTPTPDPLATATPTPPAQDCQRCLIRNLTCPTSSVRVGQSFSISYEMFGTGPTFPYEVRTWGINGQENSCIYNDNWPACQWHQLTSGASHSTPGTYTHTFKCYGADSISSNNCGKTDEPNNLAQCTVTVVELYSISGNVFKDDNKNKVKDTTPPPGEQNYTSQTSGIEIHDGSTCAGTLRMIANSNASGKYDTGNNLSAGTYTVCYLSLPTGYEMTFPTTLVMPAFFTVTVGSPGCTVPTISGIQAGNCNSGDIENLNFGITNSFPWIQSIGRDMRVDAGYSQRIPTNKFASLEGSGVTPGIIFSGNLAPDFREGQASANQYNWAVGTPPYGDKYTSSDPAHHLVTTSYEYQLSNAEDYGLTPTDLSTKCTLSNCILSSLPHDLYLANENLNLNAYTFTGDQNYVILVNGNLRIKGNILVTTGSTVTFSVKGNIYIEKGVGETPLSTTSSIDGFYSTDKDFIVESANWDIVNLVNDCAAAFTDSTKRDKRLNIGGTVVTNASLSNGKLINTRDLCGDNLTHPTIQFQERLDLILNAPRLIQNAIKTYREVPPR